MGAGGLDRINVQNNPINLIDPYGLSWAGKIVNLGVRGMKTLGRVTFKRAVKEAKSGEDIIAKNRKTAQEIARKMGNGKKPIHDRPHGPVNEGYRPHYHAHDRKGGHIFYSILAFAGSLLDPFDAEALANPEEDSDGNGIPDYLEVNNTSACE